MEIHYFKPTGLLNKYIERYWCWEIKDNGPVYLPKIIPGTGIELFFHYRMPFEIQKDSVSRIMLHSSHIACVRSKHYNLCKTENLGFIAVRFRVGAFRHFFGGSMVEIGDAFFSADELWGRQSQEVEDLLLNAISLEERVKILEHWLTGLFIRFNKEDEYIDSVINRIYYGFRDVRIDSLSKEVCLSKRQLERKLIAAIGVSPKALHKNSRFVSILRCLLLNKRKQYLEYAMDGGYYDQSHFIKDFKLYVGESPSSFLQEQNFMTHFYNERSSPFM